jgi:GNAT superfamily N-acetyltransferase
VVETMGLTPLPPSELAAVVTYLAMSAPPVAAPPPRSALALERWVRPDPGEYRELFRRVGAPWLWFSRLVMSDEALADVVHDDGVEVYAVQDCARAVGLLELDFRQPGAAALAYLGLIPALIGRGHGRWLLSRAVELAWRPGVRTVTVHTCTLDHPAALPAYRHAGFVPVRRAIETFPDPRTLGVLSAADAPQVALLASAPPDSRR